MEQVSAFTLTLRLDNIGVIVIDVPDEKVNTLKAAFVDQIREVLQQAREIPRLAGLVILSGKPDSFIAGADIAMIDACTRAEEAELLAQQGQQVMAEIAAMSVPVVAAIHGACLGGGLELALACHRRVCTLDEKTRLGLPEVQLGLLPGSGGTQRLPRIIGVTAALDMILTGRTLRPRQALKCGLVDDAVPQAILLDAAIALVRKPRDEKVPLSLRERLLSGPAGRGLLFRLAGQRAQAESHGNYPAVDKILSVVKRGLEQPQGGYHAEAQAFGELAMTPQSAALRGLFFATTALKKDPGAVATPRALHSVGVLGGGLMGGGIACVTATRAGLAVRVKDISSQGISRAMNTCWQVLSRDVKRRRLTVAERQQQMARMTGGTDYQGFHHRDVIIEAVFEDLALKQQMVSEIEAHCGPHTIFASNTSSLPIADIARGAQRPENIIGLHYFSPPEKMPLVEVIPHAGTSDDVVATTVLLAKKQGKTSIVVADRAGFYVNRILAPYIVEAMRCLIEGEPVEHIDAALVKFGFPVGPVQLLDEVGIDVGTHIMPVLQQAWGDRFALPPIFSAILNDNRKGKKNGRGFYLYNQRVGKKKKADAEIYRLLQVTPKSCSGAQDLATRCVMMMLNEAARALDEGVIRSPRDGDIGAVFGIGFPPFLGGPFRYMDSMGIAKVVNVLEELALRHDARFTPCERLKKMVEEKLTFY